MTYDKFARPTQPGNTTNVMVDLQLKHLDFDESTSVFSIYAWFSMVTINVVLFHAIKYCCRFLIGWCQSHLLLAMGRRKAEMERNQLRQPIKVNHSARPYYCYQNVS